MTSPWVSNRLYHTGMDKLWRTPRIKRLQTLRGEMGVHHSLTTPNGMEKSIENPLPRTGGAAPPLSRKKQTLSLLLTPGYPDREIFLYFVSEGLRLTAQRGRGLGAGPQTTVFGQVAQIEIGKWVCCVAHESRIVHAAIDQSGVFSVTLYKGKKDHRPQ